LSDLKRRLIEMSLGIQQSKVSLIRLLTNGEFTCVKAKGEHIEHML